MFIEFQTGNFRSFRDIQKLTMQAAPLRANDGGLEEENVFLEGDYRLLKTKAIYGANASGKSNLGKAMSAFSLMVSESVKREDLAKKIWRDRFQLITNWDDQPVFFQYTFSLDNTLFRYGFQILKEKVVFEWLFGKQGPREEQYFMRSPEGLNINEAIFTGVSMFAEQALSKEHEIFRPDALFLTGVALNGNKLATSIRNEIRSIIMVDSIDDTDAMRFAMFCLHKGTNEEKKAIKQLISAADTGIENIELLDAPEWLLPQSSKVLQKDEEDIKKHKTIFSRHSKYNEEGEVVEQISAPFIEWESEGTNKLLGIGALVLEALRKGRSIVIDEFDARFHPNLTLKIVNLFNSKKTNPNNAQLIFITYDTGLLRRADLRRDQICLVNKDKYGISSLRTLIEYKGVRKDASYEKEYLQGSYSAVPFLDEIDWVIMQNQKKDGLQEAEQSQSE